MDCLSLIEGQRKVREFFNFLMSGNPEKVNVGMSTRDKVFLSLCMRLSLCNIHFTRNKTFVLALVPHACVPSKKHV